MVGGLCEVGHSTLQLQKATLTVQGCAKNWTFYVECSINSAARNNPCAVIDGSKIRLEGYVTRIDGTACSHALKCTSPSICFPWIIPKYPKVCGVRATSTTWLHRVHQSINTASCNQASTMTDVLL